MSSGSLLSPSNLSKKSKAPCDGISLPPEPDTVIRRAIIYILKVSLIATDSEGVANHWGIVFKFQDCWVTVQANNHYGKLVPMYENSSDKPSGPLSLLKDATSLLSYEFFSFWLSTFLIKCFLPILNEIYISPHQLRNLAKIHHLNNNPYTLITTNCQLWVYHYIVNLKDYIEKMKRMKERKRAINRLV